MDSTARRQRLRENLIKVIAGDNPEAIGELTETTSLIHSGLVDSVRLLEVALFVEREIGDPVDLSEIDMERDWDTLESILRFIETARANCARVPQVL